MQKQFSADESRVYMELISQISAINTAFRDELHEVFVIDGKNNGHFVFVWRMWECKRKGSTAYGPGKNKMCSVLDMLVVVRLTLHVIQNYSCLLFRQNWKYRRAKPVCCPRAKPTVLLSLMPFHFSIMLFISRNWVISWSLHFCFEMIRFHLETEVFCDAWGI